MLKKDSKKIANSFEPDDDSTPQDKRATAQQRLDGAAGVLRSVPPEFRNMARHELEKAGMSQESLAALDLYMQGTSADMLE